MLDNMVASLDISPTDYETARSRYRAVGEWLGNGDYGLGTSVDVYLQGSFRLGTVVRPYADGQDADYDIDQVCEIAGGGGEPRGLKHEVGDRLKEHSDYNRMLDDEGRRCWTLEYAPEDGRPGFHLDVLPSRPADAISTQIRITHKEDGVYSWRSSNPKGYYRWFSERNTVSPAVLDEQMRSIFSANRELYASVDDVPKQLARTSLQRAIQAMKRHRDVCFNGREGAPISIIVTTICAHKYSGRDVLGTIRDFTEYVAGRFGAAQVGQTLPVDGVLDYHDEAWLIKNPADDRENFADKWIEDPELAKNFFAWVYQLRRDLDAFEDSGDPPDLGLAVRGIQTRETPYGERLLESMSIGPVGSSQRFLDLIHQGIEGRIPWSAVREVAVRNVDLEDDAKGKDTAWVNYYQVKIHSGAGLTADDRQGVQSILRRHASEPDFIFCCNVLLGTATADMLRACVKERGEDALRWPITRLASNQIARHSSTMVPARKFAYESR
ncbi:MAG: hypothetical protein CVT59_08340 [Actinobacteria bacterium HGW-Actinobacteria-1]|jgi:hypothetical protein|nr:MAG: hypothetical protein CVT59_08340 [Actinobacteria bacterium HGW-Actinobacteria-1]